MTLVFGTQRRETDRWNLTFTSRQIAKYRKREKTKLGRSSLTTDIWEKKLEANAMKPRELIGFLSLRKRPDDTAYYCLDCSFLPQWKHRVLVLHLSGVGTPCGRTVVRARPNEHSKSAGPRTNADLLPCRVPNPGLLEYSKISRILDS